MLQQTIFQAAPRVRSGDMHPRQLVEVCLDRIARYEDRVRAWVSVDEPAACKQADRLAAEIKSGDYRGPLHGMPIGIKDIVDVAGWPTRAGSPLREDHVAAGDATLVTRLREAGAIILGKTVTTEFACFDPSPTRNPWNTGHSPGGSSSGSAAAVAAGMCMAAIGSQTGGSITRPAAYCGVCGCKPSFGRVSRAGMVPVSFHLDHPGPLARSVQDLAIFLAAVAGADPEDPFTSDKPVPDYSLGLDRPNPPRLGYFDEFFLHEADAPVREATLEAFAKLRAAGAEVEEVPLPAGFADLLPLHRTIMAVEAAEYHRHDFPARRNDYGAKLAGLLDEGLATSAVDYARALKHKIQFSHAMRLALADVDALVTPGATSTAPATLDTTGDPKFNSPWSYTGLPTVSLPCRLAADGLPTALQLVGDSYEEAELFAAAAWCERTLDFNKSPALGPDS